MNKIEIKPQEIFIEFPRGNKILLKFQRRTEDNEIIKEPVKELVFLCKYSVDSTNAIFQKKLSEGSITFDKKDFYYRFVIESKDTQELNFGSYYVAIEIIEENVKKTIATGTLRLTNDGGVKVA